MQTNRWKIHGKKRIKEEEIDTPMIYVNGVTQNKNWWKGKSIVSSLHYADRFMIFRTPIFRELIHVSLK